MKANMDAYRNKTLRLALCILGLSYIIGIAISILMANTIDCRIHPLAYKILFGTVHPLILSHFAVLALFGAIAYALSIGVPIASACALFVGLKWRRRPLAVLGAVFLGIQWMGSVYLICVSSWWR